MTGQAVFLELTLLASVTHKKNPYLVNVAFAVGRLFTKLCPVKLTSKAFKMSFFIAYIGFIYVFQFMIKYVSELVRKFFK